MRNDNGNKRKFGLDIDTLANGSMLAAGILIVIFAVVGDIGEAVRPAGQVANEVMSWLG